MPVKPLTFSQRCSFSAVQHPLHNSSALTTDISNLYQLISTITDDKTLLTELEQAYKSTLFLIEIAPKYDYSPNVRANGFWIFVQIVIKFFRLTLYSIKKGCFNSDVTRTALQVLNISLKGCEDMATVNDNNNNNDHNNDHNNNNDSSTDYSLFISSPDHRTELDYLMEQASRSSDEFVSFFENFNVFWLQPCAMQVIQGISDTMGIIYKQSTDFCITRNIFSRRMKAKMFQEMTMKVTIAEMKRSWNMLEVALFRKVFNRFARDDKKVIVRDVAIPSQSRWKISTNEHSTVYDLEGLSWEEREGKQFAVPSRSGVDCWILHSKMRAPERSGAVLLHIHGGGFISQSAKSHKVYLQDWIDKYKDLTIVSVNYRLSPKHPYPAALQDILDVYIWLLNKESSRILGFSPTKIAMAGDSAGGNLSVAMCLVLNSLSRIIPRNDPFLADFYLPKAIFSFYGLFMIAPINSPSHIFAIIDGALNLRPLLTCFYAYVPVSVDEQETYNEFARNPFLSPLLYSDWEFTNDIDLYLFEPTFDMFLDDNVELAKRWKGRVVLDVQPDLPHGFLHYIKCSPKCQQANDRCLEHFAQFCNANKL